MIPFELAGESLVALPGRGLWWPRRSTLLVADVHLGKGAAFRRAGVAVPSGATAASLARLQTMLDDTRAARLLVLGDLLHTALTVDEPASGAFAAFRRDHAGLAIDAVLGNHDRATAALPRDWRVGWHPFLVEPPFVCAHVPAPDSRGYVLAGHVHPVLRLSGANDSLRLPVFWFGGSVGVLPAFGEFTGGWAVRPRPGDRLIGVTPDGLLDLPAPRLPETS